NIFSGAIFGFIGGATRAALGLIKSLRRKEKFSYRRFIVYLLASILIGIFTGMLYNSDNRLSLVAGYAGTDILEGIYKVKTRKV
ncbi:hypothetical protein D6777_02625, partial [Candidatus Woesearchaeota archaeon]